MKSVSELLSWEIEKNDAVTIDDILVYLGEFGRYQKTLFLVLMLFCIFLVMVYFTQLFLTVVPTEHWCRLPHVEGVTTERLRELMIPSSDLVPYEGHQLAYSRCWMYDLPVEQILAVDQPDDTWPLKRCTDWDFNYTKEDVPYSSIATEQYWVCEDAYKATMAQSIFFVGAIFGGFIFGWLSDKYGRVPALMGTTFMGFIGGVSTIYSTTFWGFCACRFVVGFAYDNTFVLAYILVLEYVGPRWRTFAANMSYGIFFTGAAMGLPWIAYYIADWKMLSLVTSIPLATAILVPCLIPESIRWLISKGKIERAVKIMTEIEKINGKEIPQDVYDDFLDDCVATAEQLSNENHTIIDLFRTKRMRRITLLLVLTWSLIQMAYDGHIRCLDSLGMDVFTTFTIASATEFPALMFLAYMLDILGRRWTLFASVILSAVFSVSAAQASIGFLFASLAMVARLFINIASNIALQYAAELLPTVVRGEGVSFIHTMGYVSSILSPYVAFTARIQYNLPMFILGGTAVFAGCLCIFLPETLREQLPQTMMDGELFGIDQSFWETPFTRKKPLEPKWHHLHAKRPVSRAAMLRSSMVSGYLGNKRRLKAVKERLDNRVLVPMKNTPTIAGSTPKSPKKKKKGTRDQTEDK